MSNNCEPQVHTPGAVYQLGKPSTGGKVKAHRLARARGTEVIMVTGASGTLGYSVVRMIATRKPHARVAALSRSKDLRLFDDLPNVEVVRLDLLKTADLWEVVGRVRPDTIIHCAAAGLSSDTTPWFDLLRINVGATLNLFEASCAANSHFIHISTGLVYRPQDRPLLESDPVDTAHAYGSSKALAESMLRASSKRTGKGLTVARPFSFTGINDANGRLFPSLLESAQARTPFEMSEGNQIRDFCSVQDAAAAINLLVDREIPASVATYNIGSGAAIRLRDLVEGVCLSVGLDVEIKFGARQIRPQEPMYLVADPSRIRELGWRPRSSVAHAVFELARSRYPALRVKSPELLTG